MVPPRLMTILLTLLLVSAMPGRAQDYGFTLDFEQGNLRGWNKTGTAFDFQPTRGDNPTARNRGQPSNHVGNYWIGTYERFQGRRGERPGTTQGDRPTGTLTSPAFEVPRGTLSFLIGGGQSFETRVELRILDQIEGAIRVETAQGSNNETMRRVEWNLDPHAGKMAQVRIIDASSGGWGHINVDDFRFNTRDVLRIPNLIGRNIEQARRLLARLELRVMAEEVPSRDHAPGEVFQQAPEPRSEVRPGQRVQLIYASGPDMTAVPRVIGKLLPEAEREIEAARLGVGRVGREPSDANVDTVLDQRPAPESEVPAGSSVDLLVSEDPGLIEVPPLVGQPIRRASNWLNELGLVAGGEAGRFDERPEGTVIEQNPSPGTQVERGSVVILVLSRGPERVSVPDLLGISREAAEVRLQEARLRLGASSSQPDRSEPGTVIGQEPAAGEIVNVNTPVTMVLSAGPPGIVVPDVVGASQEDGTQEVRQSGFRRVDIVEEQQADRPGTIIRQRPEAGTRVPPETTITLVVAIPPPAPDRVPVPGLSGLPVNQAIDAIVAAQLQVGSVSDQASDSPADTVIEQSPAAGTFVPAGSQVHLVRATADTRSIWPPWIPWAVVGALLAITLTTVAVTRVSKTHQGPGISDIRTVAVADPGSASVQSEAERLVKSDLVLRTVADIGRQSIEDTNDLITDEHRDDQDDQ